MLLKILNIKIFIVLLLCGAATSCSNINSSYMEDDDGISIIKTKRIYHSLSPTISDSAFAIVKDLFKKNNLALSNLQVYPLLKQNGYHYVSCYQFYNGLELFTNDVVLTFNNNDQYVFLGGEFITRITIDMVPKVSYKSASDMFYAEILSDGEYKDSLASFRERGFNAELGIYDLNAGLSYATKNFVLAWKLTMANGLRFPRCFIRADVLRLINYSRGIIFIN